MPPDVANFYARVNQEEVRKKYFVGNKRRGDAY